MKAEERTHAHRSAFIVGEVVCGERERENAEATEKANVC